MVEREQDWKMRKTKETIHIRLQGAAMNRDQGIFLSWIYDPIFANLRKIGENSRGSQPRVTPRMSAVVDETVNENNKVSAVFRRKNTPFSFFVFSFFAIFFFRFPFLFIQIHIYDIYIYKH